MIRVAVTAVLLFGAVAVADDSALDTTESELAALAIPADGDPFSISPKGRLAVVAKHTFVRTEAVTRLGYLLSYWKKRFNIESEWHGDRVFLSGSVYGIKIQAMFAINETAIVGFAHDPGWPWRGQVQNYVDRKLKKYLNVNYDEP